MRRVLTLLGISLKLSHPVILGILVILGNASGTCCQILISGTKAKADSRDRTAHGGCSLTASAAAEMQGQLQLSRTVWNPAQDAAFNKIMANIDRLFGVNPAFFIFNDQSSPNAFATPQIFDPHYRDGSVMFGYQLFSSQVQQTGPVNFTVAAIMAHEFAHILQFKLGEDLPTQAKELEADYMAGWYIGNSGDAWQGQISSQALRAFYSLGDFAFNSPTHHGTPDERTRAVEAGIRDARSPLRKAFADAHQFVGTN